MASNLTVKIDEHRKIYDMNVQTEDRFEDVIGDHPVEMVNQNTQNYSPQPFEKVAEVPDYYEKKRQESKMIEKQFSPPVQAAESVVSGGTEYQKVPLAADQYNKQRY